VTAARRARRRRRGTTLAAVLLSAAVLPASVSAHARISPAVSLSGQLQLYTLAVPTEKTGVTTVGVMLSVPSSFSIDSFAASPGWHRAVQAHSSGQNTVIERVTWNGGHVPTNEDSVFSFLGEAAKPGQVRFTVQQTYSDGSIVDWNGTEASPAPAPTIDTVGSLSGGGGGSGGASLLAIVAIVLAVLALLASGLALADRGGGGRPLA
jgi:uncharacterized protein YcnI